MRKTKRQPFNYLFRTYRAALKGDELATKFLLELAIASLEQMRVPPRGLNKFFLRTLQDPNQFKRIMKATLKLGRGRPSIDDRDLLTTTGLRAKTLFGYKPSERHALAITYLIAQGHTLNESGNFDKDSAAVIMSELTGRSWRALQDDYSKHKKKIDGLEFAVGRGESEYKRYIALAKLKSSFKQN